MKIKLTLLLALIATRLLFAEAETETLKVEPKEHKGMSMEAQANNPLAHFFSLVVQDYYYSALTDTDATANMSFVRAAFPTGRWLWRASLPIPSMYPHGSTLLDNGVTSKSGIGDMNIFASYLISSPLSSVQYGIGPMINIPTGDDEKGLGSGNWSAGLAAVYYNASSDVLQWGGLITWAKSFTNNTDDEYAKEINILDIQPFVFLQLGKGYYTGTAPIWNFDLKDDSYNIPLGIRIGKVTKIGDTVANIFIEPQYSIVSRGAGQPEFGLFFSAILQFKGL